jgi:hypothetical protein
VIMESGFCWKQPQRTDHRVSVHLFSLDLEPTVRVSECIGSRKAHGPNIVQSISLPTDQAILDRYQTLLPQVHSERDHQYMQPPLLRPDLPRLSSSHNNPQLRFPIFDIPKPLFTFPSIQIPPIKRYCQPSHLFTIPIPDQLLHVCSIFNGPILFPFGC